MKPIKLILDIQNDEIKCPRCQSNNCGTRGKRKHKPRYRCNDCGKWFASGISNRQRLINAKTILPENISPQGMKYYDAWDLRILGKKAKGNGSYSINFIGIKPEWLKQAAKEFIWSIIPAYNISTIQQYVGKIKTISDFVEENNFYLNPENIDRKLVHDLINHISQFNLESRTISAYLTTWKKFFDYCQENNIILNHNQKLILSEDYPKRKKTKVKDIPGYVLKQLREKIHFLPKPIALSVKILLETGIRISELCALSVNCLQQDSDGDFWLHLYRIKMKKEDRLLVSKELALEIQEQQKFLQEKFEYSFNNLFCSTEGSGWFQHYTSKNRTKEQTKKKLDHFIPILKPIRQGTIRGYLYELAHEHKITDVSGEIYPVWKCHRFRHTHLTDLARKGTGIAHIMQRAGHASPAMSIEYIHLTNDDQKKKMKEVWDNTHFNMEGEIVAPVNPDLDTAEMQWIKKGMGMQTTDNGYCTLLWTQTCPHQDLPCKSCGSWVTTLDFLDSHKQELEETEKIIENARQKHYQRQIEKNVPRAERLRKIISGMEKHQTMRGLGHNEWEEKE